MKKTAIHYDLFDMCYGKITARCKQGAYLELDNGETAFAYKISNVPLGSKVLCSILRKAQEDRKMLVSVDSVCEYAA